MAPVYLYDEYDRAHANMVHLISRIHITRLKFGIKSGHAPSKSYSISHSQSDHPSHREPGKRHNRRSSAGTKVSICSQFEAIGDWGGGQTWEIARGSCAKANVGAVRSGCHAWLLWSRVCTASSMEALGMALKQHPARQAHPTHNSRTSTQTRVGSFRC